MQIRHPKLTRAQWSMLLDVVRDGERIYNGRAVRTIHALRDHALVTDEWHLEPHADGRYTERHTVRPTPGGIKLVRGGA